MTTFQKAVKYLAMAFAIFLIVSIFSGIFSAVGLLGGLGESGVADETKTYAVSGDVHDLKIEIGAADLTVKAGEVFSVESNLKYLSVETENGCLTLEETKKNGLNYTDAVLTLYIPEGVTFGKINIVTGAGRLTAEVLSGDVLRLDLGAGQVQIGQLNANTRADIHGGAGQVTVSAGTLHDLDLDMGVGEVDLTAALTGSCELDYGVGEARLTLIGAREDYRIDFDKGLGSATIDGENMMDDKVYGNGENRIDIDGGVGGLRIQFRDE